MKILLIGATGTIGAAVARALAGHEVIGVTRRTDPRVDIDEPASVRAVFQRVPAPDAVVCCAGNAVFQPLEKLTDADFEFSVRSKLVGQVNVVRAALGHLLDGGSVTVTSGVLAQKPMLGSAAVSLVNAGLEGFVRAAALEAPRGIRVNVVSPPWVSETLAKMGMDPKDGLPAAEVAKAYVAAVEGSDNGRTLDPAAL
jgi:NAD(P)-dependent dehydrogenase (short-subunit alcohol dehydrogenase family)